MKKILIIVTVIGLGILLVGCSKDEKVKEHEPLDLNGHWVDTQSNGETWQEANIDNETIVIYWVYADGTKALYWAGDIDEYENVKENGAFTWSSHNDTSQTDGALFASMEEYKEFKYEKGNITYETTVLGLTKTVTLEKENA